VNALPPKITKPNSVADSRRTSLLILLPLVGLLLYFSGCVSAGNNQVATYQKIGDRYLIEVSGTRTEMAHDPIELLKHKTYETRWQFDVPRIDGKIDGKEIRPKKGFLPYVGTITIHGSKMTVSLSSDNYVYKKLERVDWNGSYTLVEKKDGGPKAEPEKKQ
jgi:hypothetical protein